MAERRILMVGLALACAVVCAAGPAAASPRSDPTIGPAVFTGATTPSATSIGLNPAALGLGAFDAVYVALTGTIDQLHVDLAPFNAGGLSAPGAKVRDVEPSPGGMIAFIYHLAGDRGTLGFEARTNPRESFAEGEPALKYHTLGGGERDWLASAGASIKVTSELFFGASLSHQNTFLRLRYARDTALAATDPTRGIGGNCGPGAPCTLEDPRATETYDFDVSSSILSTANLKVNVGIVVQLARDMWLGVAYHTPPGLGIQTELAGHVDVTRAPRDLTSPDDPPVLHGQSVAEIQFPASVDAEFRTRLPADLDLHIAGRWEDLSRFTAYDVRTFGTTLPSNDIPEWTERPRGMQDGFAFWGGVEQVDTGQRWLFGARLGFETASVTDDRLSPLTIAPASFTIDLGAQWRISRVLVAQLSYGLQYFPPVDVKHSEFDPTSQLTCAASGYDYATAACEAVREGYAIPPADGTYERLQHAIRIGLRYDLQ
ncbi:MAG TPA: hypothetical protein VH165_33625 [Kofleriaceae bacterium]|jgi:hypothetical protein|nr:hypothetical protein [Kofleriaceae bacterium]